MADTTNDSSYGPELAAVNPLPLVRWTENMWNTLSPQLQRAMQKIGLYSKDTGNEAFIYGRGPHSNDPGWAARMVTGEEGSVALPESFFRRVRRTSDTPGGDLWTAHTHPGPYGANPSGYPGDLGVWRTRGAADPLTLYTPDMAEPWQRMHILAPDTDQLLSIDPVSDAWRIGPLPSQSHRLKQEFQDRTDPDKFTYAIPRSKRLDVMNDWAKAHGVDLPDLEPLSHIKGSNRRPSGRPAEVSPSWTSPKGWATYSSLSMAPWLKSMGELGIGVEMPAEQKLPFTNVLMKDALESYLPLWQRESKAEGGPVRMAEGGIDKVVKAVGALSKAARTARVEEILANLKRGAVAEADPQLQTVTAPLRMANPGIYRNPKDIPPAAMTRLIPDPGEEGNMFKLFGHTRASLDELAQGRSFEEGYNQFLPPAYRILPGSKGSAISSQILTPRNANRLIDIASEALNYEPLAQTRSWYEMLPLWERMNYLGISPEEQRLFNARVGLHSAASSPVAEIARGTEANRLIHEGRLEDYVRYGGVGQKGYTDRQGNFRPGRFEMEGFPPDMLTQMGHLAHSTAHADPLIELESTGRYWPAQHKIGTYIQATDPQFPDPRRPIADSHLARGVGYPDVRTGDVDIHGELTNPEFADFVPWWGNISDKMGMHPRDLQAMIWNVLGPQTGVRYIGPPKLEMFADQAAKAGRRLGVNPETALDMILTGQAAGYAEGGPTRRYDSGSDFLNSSESLSDYYRDDPGALSRYYAERRARKEQNLKDKDEDYWSKLYLTDPVRWSESQEPGYRADSAKQFARGLVQGFPVMLAGTPGDLSEMVGGPSGYGSKAINDWIERTFPGLAPKYATNEGAREVGSLLTSLPVGFGKSTAQHLVQRAPGTTRAVLDYLAASPEWATMKTWGNRTAAGTGALGALLGTGRNDSYTDLAYPNSGEPILPQYAEGGDIGGNDSNNWTMSDWDMPKPGESPLDDQGYASIVPGGRGPFGNQPDNPMVDAWVHQQETPKLPSTPDLGSTQQQQSSGGGGGDQMMGQLISLGMKVLPMLLAKKGGRVDELYHPVAYQDWGDESSWFAEGGKVTDNLPSAYVNYDDGNQFKVLDWIAQRDRYLHDYPEFVYPSVQEHADGGPVYMGTGGQIGGTIGSLIGSIFGPIGSIAGRFLGDAAGNLIGGEDAGSSFGDAGKDSLSGALGPLKGIFGNIFGGDKTGSGSGGISDLLGGDSSAASASDMGSALPDIGGSGFTFARGGYLRNYR